MKRRGFLRGALGTAAAVVVAPIESLAKLVPAVPVARMSMAAPSMVPDMASELSVLLKQVYGPTLLEQANLDRIRFGTGSYEFPASRLRADRFVAQVEEHDGEYAYYDGDGELWWED